MHDSLNVYNHLPNCSFFSNVSGGFIGLGIRWIGFLFDTINIKYLLFLYPFILMNISGKLWVQYHVEYECVKDQIVKFLRCLNERGLTCSMYYWKVRQNTGRWRPREIFALFVMWSGGRFGGDGAPAGWFSLETIRKQTGRD